MTDLPANYRRLEHSTEEWVDFRMGKITSSRMGDVLAGKQTKRYQGYLRDLVRERNGFVHYEMDQPWYEHGKWLEPHGARKYAELVKIRPILSHYVTIHPEYWFILSSPDRIVGEEGLAEIKSRDTWGSYNHHVHTAKTRKRRTPRGPIAPLEELHRPQLMGQLMCAQDRQWVDLVNYHQDYLDSHGHLHCNCGTVKCSYERVFRDEYYISWLEFYCLEFELAIRKCFAGPVSDPDYSELSGDGFRLLEAA